MKTRSFIGLLLLIIALVAVSAPPVLEQAAIGIDEGATKLGLPPGPPPAVAGQLAAPTDGDGVQTELEKTLYLHGYDVGDPNLRDRFTDEERAALTAGRLAAGERRLALPGEDTGADDVPPLASDGVLLDIDGCPRFDPDDDVAALLADDAVAQLYSSAIADADDPTGCADVFDARITAALDSSASSDAVLTRRSAERDVRATTRAGILAELTLQTWILAVEDVFGTTDYGDAVAAELAARSATESDASAGDTTTDESSSSSATDA